MKTIRDEWEARAIPVEGQAVPLQTDFVRKLNYTALYRTKWSCMSVSLNMKLNSATVSRHFRTINPALSWFTGATNDLLDQFNAQQGTTRAIRFGAIGVHNMRPLERMEEIFSEFLDWKSETRDQGHPLKYLHAVTHSNLRQTILGFTAMCRHYLKEFPASKIPQWRVNDDALEHNFRNIRGAFRDDTNPTIAGCCAATRHATIIRIVGDNSGNSGSAPRNADDNDDAYRSFAPIPPPGMSKQEQIFTFNFQYTKK